MASISEQEKKLRRAVRRERLSRIGNLLRSNRRNIALILLVPMLYYLDFPVDTGDEFSGRVQGDTMKSTGLSGDREVRFVRVRLENGELIELRSDFLQRDHEVVVQEQKTLITRRTRYSL